MASDQHKADGRRSLDSRSLGLAADNVKYNNLQIKAYYDLAKKRTGRGKKARVAVMRKLVRMLYFMLKTGQNWKWQDPEVTRAKISRLDSLAFDGVAILIVFYLEIGAGVSAFEAGVAIVPMDVTFLIFSLIAGKLSDKYGSRLFCSIGLVITAASLFLVASFDPSASLIWVELLTGIMGIGNGLFVVPNTRAIMSTVPTYRRGIAAAFRSTMFNVAVTSSFGLVILLMTIGIPYSVLSQLLQGSIPFAPEAREFMNGFRSATMIIAILQTVAIIPSSIGEQRKIKDLSQEI